MAEVVVGIDLGGTAIKTAVVTSEGEVTGWGSRPTRADAGPEAIMDDMAAGVEQALSDSGHAREEVLAVGAGSPGPMNWREGIIFEAPNLAGWRNVKLAEGLSNRLNLPCYIENDANAAGYGEYWQGAGRGTSTMCLLTLGTGIGGGLVINGKLFRGIDGTAAEFGHMKIQRDGRECGCGGRGCLETYGSVTGMIRTAMEGLGDHPDSSLAKLGDGENRLTGSIIADAAEEGDAYAREVIRLTGEWIGIGISNLVNILNPERVVLCGGMIAAGELLFEPIRETAMANAFEVPAKRAQIVPAGLGQDSGVIGAAGVALERYTLEHNGS